MLAALARIVLAIWTLAGVPATHDAPLLAEILARAVLGDAPNAPIYDSHLTDLAVLAVTVEEESGVMVYPIPRTWEGIAGMTCGPFGLPCFVVRSHPLAGQAELQLRLMREGLTVCPRRPIAPDPDHCVGARDVADERVDRARALLRLAL